MSDNVRSADLVNQASSPIAPESTIRTLHAGYSESEFNPIAEALAYFSEIDCISYRPHGTDVAIILKKLGVDPDTLIAAILSDSRLEEKVGIRDIEQSFGQTVATLVKNVRWLNSSNVYTPVIASKPDQAEILRRMLLAMVDDVRAVLIKLAFRVVRLRNLPREDYEIRRFIASETLDIYACLANRLGIGSLKWELEDLAFRYLNPQSYKNLSNLLLESRSQRERYVLDFIQLLKINLEHNDIHAKVFGRPKHIYSIWKKMQRKNVDFNDVYDLRAVRVIVDSISTCYAALGSIHGTWQNVPHEFDDYIANPKTNGYQSLHTVIVGPNDALTEIQIRTTEMDQFAELGVAAHWRYKEIVNHDKSAADAMESLRRLLDNKHDDHKLLEDFRTDLYTDRIFVFTPNRELKELPRGATPLDFAYSIHTEIGHRCRGAKINQRIVPLTYTLQTGEQVEILTAKAGSPSRNWLDPHLGYLLTPNARAKVRTWFRKQAQERIHHAGKSIFERQLRKLGIRNFDQTRLVKHFRVTNFEELLIGVGRAEISLDQLNEALIPPEKAEVLIKCSAPRKPEKLASAHSINVNGTTNLLTSFAKCCKPIHGDQIIGFISGSKGLVVHRHNCKNIRILEIEKRNRIVQVEWGVKGEAQTANITIRANDRPGLLKDITQVLAAERINILSTSSRSSRIDQTVGLFFSLDIVDKDQLERILTKINRIPDVVRCNRNQ